MHSARSKDLLYVIVAHGYVSVSSPLSDTGSLERRIHEALTAISILQGCHIILLLYLVQYMMKKG